MDITGCRLFQLHTRICAVLRLWMTNIGVVLLTTITPTPGSTSRHVPGVGFVHFEESDTQVSNKLDVTCLYSTAYTPCRFRMAGWPAFPTPLIAWMGPNELAVGLLIRNQPSPKRLAMCTSVHHPVPLPSARHSSSKSNSTSRDNW